jgi:hypothetical protein
MSNQRIVFTFDDRSLEGLKRMQAEGQYSSMAKVVRDSLRISRALQQQATEGFSEVIVRNPKTGEARVVVVPQLVGDKE